MNLFFETASQARSFLTAVPVGFCAVMCLDCGRGEGVLRAAIDLLLMLLTGLGMMLMVFALQEDGLRLYHALGGIVGALLYLRGVGRVKRAAKALMRSLQKERNPQS